MTGISAQIESYNDRQTSRDAEGREAIRHPCALHEAASLKESILRGAAEVATSFV